MLRTILSVLSGLLVGAAGAYHFMSGNSPGAGGTVPAAAPDRAALSRSAPAAAEALAQLLATGEPLQRSTLYAAAAAADAGDLRAQIEALVDTRASQTQRVALGIVFARYAELDPAGSIAALALLREPHLAETMGLEILDVIGTDDFNIGWVAGGLNKADPLAFRVEAIASLAESAPAAALQLALLTDSRAHRSHAVRRLAGAWARRDPAAALAAADRLSDDALRDTLRSVAGQEWARVRPESLLSLLGSLSSRAEFIELGRTGAVNELADAHPQRLLEFAEGLPAEFANDVKAAALRNWSESDPLAAYDYSQTMPAGQRRQQTQQQIARIYGRSDPGAALLWLEGIDDPTGELTSHVLQGVAETEPELALSVAFDESTDLRQSWASQLIMMRAATGNPERMPEIANIVLALDDESQRNQALGMLTQSWARIDGRGALEWALSQSPELPDNVLSQIASQLVQENPAAAIEYVNRVRPEQRDTWISNVARGYARYDRQAALEWVGQFRGQEVYVPAMLSIVRSTIDSDPQEAARLLGSIGTPPRTGTYTIAQIVGRWSERDADAARSYALELPRGELRDAALVLLAGTNDNTAMPNADTLAAFSSDLAREQAIVRVIGNVARDDPVRARQLIDEHVSFPMLRQQAEETLRRRGR